MFGGLFAKMGKQNAKEALEAVASAATAAGQLPEALAAEKLSEAVLSAAGVTVPGPALSP